MTIAENLQRIQTAKADIKTAIENKGVNVGDITIDGYAAKIDEIKQEGKISVHNVGVKLSYVDCDSIPDALDFTGISDNDLIHFFEGTNISNWDKLSEIDTSTIKNLSHTFYRSNFADATLISNWDVSEVTSMEYMFANLYQITDLTPISNWDTSKVTSMANMAQSCLQLKTIPYMNCINVTANNYPLFNLGSIVNLGGFYMKNSWNNNYGLVKCTNLTVESLVNVLNALYDFTGKGETPTTNEGKLALGATNLAKLTDEQKAIATNKGWTLS